MIFYKNVRLELDRERQKYKETVANNADTSEFVQEAYDNLIKAME